MRKSSSLSTAVHDLDVKATAEILETQLREGNSRGIFSEIRRNLDAVLADAWYGRNWFWLSLVDAVELIGLDCDIEKTISQTRHVKNYTDFQKRAVEKLIDKVRRQLRAGGPTLFYDAEAMTQKDTAILVEDLLKARQVEIVKACSALSSSSKRNLAASGAIYTHDGLELVRLLAPEEEGFGYWGLGYWGVDSVYDEGYTQDVVWERMRTELNTILDTIPRSIVSSYRRKDARLNTDSKMKEILDAFFADPREGEEWWWERGRVPNEIRPLVDSGFLDSSRLVSFAVRYFRKGSPRKWDWSRRGYAWRDSRFWRFLPPVLRKLIKSINKRDLLPFAVAFLARNHYPGLPSRFPYILKELDEEEEASFVIESLKEPVSLEVLESIVDYFKHHSGGVPDRFPHSLDAAATFIGAHSHLMPDKQMAALRRAAYRGFRGYYSKDDVMEMNRIVLLSQGPNSVEFAKDVIVGYDGNMRVFIDSRMLEFLVSRGADAVSAIVNHTIRLWGEFECDFDVITEVMKDREELKPAIRRGFEDLQAKDPHDECVAEVIARLQESF